MNCQRTGCKGEAKWCPVIEVTPDQIHYAKVELGELATCDACKLTITLADLINDAGWKRIAGGFLSVGMAEPRREWTRLTWVSLQKCIK